MRPIINDPQFNVVVPFSKKVGLVSSTTANMQVTMSKNFFIAGEMCYLMVNIDNSQCKNACQLIISHKTKIKIYQNWKKYSVHRCHRKESFFLAGPNESKQVILQFQIATKRVKPPGTGFHGKHAADYYNVSTLVPESVFAQSFSSENYLELYLSHDSTVFSNDSTRKFYFQLIQPSLVPGVVELPPPIFLDHNGQLLSMDAPVIGAPEGECIQGTAMDVGATDKTKKGEDDEPSVGPAV